MRLVTVKCMTKLLLMTGLMTGRNCSPTDDCSKAGLDNLTESMHIQNRWHDRRFLPQVQQTQAHSPCKVR